MINYSKYPLREENREVSWDQHNYVCDQEVEKISERMSKMPSINDTAIEGEHAASQVQSCPNDVGLPTRDIPNLSDVCPASRQIVPNSNCYQATRHYDNHLQTQQYYMMSDQPSSHGDPRMPISTDPNSLYSNVIQMDMMKKQLMAQQQTGMISTSSVNSTEAVNNQSYLRSQTYSNAKSQVRYELFMIRPSLGASRFPLS